MKFCEILREILKDNGMNQAALALKLNIKPSQISEWLKEKANPGYETLKNFATVLNLSGDYLLGLEDDFGKRASIPSAPVVQNMAYSESERDLIEAFRGLMPETQDFVLRSVQALNGKKSEIK